MTDPTISYDPALIPGKPHALTFAWDEEDCVLFLTPAQLDTLLAAGAASRTAHHQATCNHDWVTDLDLFDDQPETRSCDRCGAVEVVEPDGTFVPVAEAGAS